MHILQNQEREYMLKDMDVYHLLEVYPTNMEKKILDTATKTTSKKRIYKAPEATG